MVIGGGWLYIGWRRALPQMGYLELFCRNYSKFSGNLQVAQRFQLKRFGPGRIRMGHQVLFSRLSLGLEMGLRLLELQALFLPLLISSPLLFVGQERLWYRLMVRVLRMGGPAFVKLGQWAASRPDVLPPALCTELGALHSKAPAHSLTWTQHILREAGLSGMLSAIDSEPVGSGAVGQVYRGVSVDGKVVAIKVLHPGVEEQVRLDLALLTLAAQLIDRLPGLAWLQLPEETKYFRHAMFQQLDLRYEAYTLTRFRRNFRASPLVSFPEPLAATQHCLIESFEGGLPIGAFTRVPDGPGSPCSALKKELASRGLQAFLQMLLWDNLVHADLHPGNMLVKFPTNPTVNTVSDAVKAYSEGHAATLVFLDTGLVTELSAKDHVNFTDLFKALVFHGDGALAGRLIIERAPENAAQYVKDPDGFCLALDQLVRPVFAGPQALLHLSDFAISPLLLHTFDLVREHHVHLHGAYTNLVMSMVCVEGLGRQLVPQLSLRPLLLSAGLQYLATSLAKTVTETVEPFL